MAGAFISFLTDFGAGASAPAVCRGVILGIAPDARILDLTHAVRKFGVRDGAFLLCCAVPYLPVGIHLAVVDPGVGTSRRPIAIRASRGDILVGPDNGLLMPAARALGGVEEVRVLENAELWLPRISSTFHGRDLFAPVTAHLARGEPLASVGPVIDRAATVDLRLPQALARDGGLDTAVIYIDSFGNCRLAGERADLAALGTALEPGARIDLLIGEERVGLAWANTFGEVGPGEPIVYEDADYAGLALAVNQGSAAERFALELDRPVRLEPA